VTCLHDTILVKKLPRVALTDDAACAISRGAWPR